MGKAEREEKRLNMALISHLSNIHETLQALDRTPASSSPSHVKSSWDEAVKMGEQVSKHATMAGMLWSGNKPEVKVLEQNMQAYFNMLQGLVLQSHSSSAGAGQTLLSSINVSIKQVVDCSFMLWKESVSTYASSDKGKIAKIPQLVGTVWEACSALKKTPSSNITAIGRAMTQVAVSMKDVLREMQELKPSSTDEPDESSSSTANQTKDDSNNGGIDVDDLGNDLSPEEMKIAQTATRVISDALTTVKELIRSITGLLKRENMNETNDGVESLERLLKLCQDIGVQIDELGASLYPPQELASISSISDVVTAKVDEMLKELDVINGTTVAFSEACSNLKDALAQLKSEVDVNDDEQESIDAVKLVPQMKNLNVGS
ncbi:hypothetical protein V2J09_003548 [Rumex salicifolius]